MNTKFNKTIIISTIILGILSTIAWILIWIYYGFWTMMAVTTVSSIILYIPMILKFGWKESLSGTWILRYMK